jgi:serine/threonine-protein kinase
MGRATGEAPEMIGRTVGGKFVIESRIGGGAMGDVFLAKHIALDSHIALKVMHDDLAKDPRFAERFHREAKAASKLNHPNSVRVIDFGQDQDGVIYLAMELLQGRDLLKVLNEDWPIPPERIVALMSQTLGALQVAHDAGIVHRDLKPENIMIVAGKDDEGNPIDVVKVCDFGIAKISDSRSFQTEKGQPALTQTGSLIGTPEYMSPEQARGDALDSRSDLYSMGVVLYQLLCGDLPFTGENALGVVLKVVTDDARPPSSVREGIHPSLEAVCMKAIAKGRGDRYQTAKEMRAALREALGRGPVVGYPDSLSQPMGVKVPSSGGALHLGSARPKADSSAMSHAPTLDVMGAAVSSPNASPSQSGPFAPKDTSNGTALGPQVERKKSGNGLVFAILVAVLGLGVGVGAVMIPRMRKAAATTAPNGTSSGVATDLNPLEERQTFAKPLGSGTEPKTGPSSNPSVGNVSGNGKPVAPPVGSGKGAKTSGSGRPGSSAAPSSSPGASAAPSAAPAVPPGGDHPAEPTAAYNPQNAQVDIGIVNPTGVKVAPLRKQFNAVRGQLSTCYRNALIAKGSRVDGTATFNLSIDGSGLISGVVVMGLDQLPQATRCFQTTVFHQQLPANSLEGPSATAEVWVTLRPE